MSESGSAPPLVLMVDDDEEDVYMTRRAFAADARDCRFRAVHDGDGLFAYLDNRGEFADACSHPRPRLILMDINMPRENGFELLARIRGMAAHASIPVIVMSTSLAAQDIDRAYRLGANAFVGKPVTAQAMKALARHVRLFWFDTAVLP